MSASKLPNQYLMSIADNLKNVIEKIENSSQIRQHKLPDCALPKNRSSGSAVKLLAVSKTQSAKRIREAVDAGLSAFGENYLQEALLKMKELASLPIEWHFIGPIQSNKTRQIARHFDWVQSVSRFKIAQRLSEQRPSDTRPLKILLQVNINEEESKSGMMPSEVSDMASKVMTLPNIELRGLMAIPESAQTKTSLGETFCRLFTLFQELKQKYPDQIDTLSMGMSGDYELAIMEGATLVRIGTALFGTRQI